MKRQQSSTLSEHSSASAHSENSDDASEFKKPWYRRWYSRDAKDPLMMHSHITAAILFVILAVGHNVFFQIYGKPALVLKTATFGWSVTITDTFGHIWLTNFEK